MKENNNIKRTISRALLTPRKTIKLWSSWSTLLVVGWYEWKIIVMLSKDTRIPPSLVPVKSSFPLPEFPPSLTEVGSALCHQSASHSKQWLFAKVSCRLAWCNTWSIQEMVLIFDIVCGALSVSMGMVFPGPHKFEKRRGIDWRCQRWP